MSALGPPIPLPTPSSSSSSIPILYPLKCWTSYNAPPTLALRVETLSYEYVSGDIVELKEASPTDPQERYVITSIHVHTNPQGQRTRTYYLTSLQTCREYNEKSVTNPSEQCILRNEQTKACPYTWIGPFTFPIYMLGTYPGVPPPQLLAPSKKGTIVTSYLQAHTVALWKETFLKYKIIPLIQYITNRKVLTYLEWRDYIKASPRPITTTSEEGQGSRTIFTVKCMCLWTPYTHPRAMEYLEVALSLSLEEKKQLWGDDETRRVQHPDEHIDCLRTMPALVTPVALSSPLYTLSFSTQKWARPSTHVRESSPRLRIRSSLPPPIPLASSSFSLKKVSSSSSSSSFIAPELDTPMTFTWMQEEYMAFMRYREQRSIFDDLYDTYRPRFTSTLPLCQYQMHAALDVSLLQLQPTQEQTPRGGWITDHGGGSGKRVAMMGYLYRSRLQALRQEATSSCVETLIFASDQDAHTWKLEGMRYSQVLEVVLIQNTIQLQTEWARPRDTRVRIWVITFLAFTSSLSADSEMDTGSLWHALFETRTCRRVIVDMECYTKSAVQLLMELHSRMAPSCYRWMVMSNAHAFQDTSKIYPTYQFLGLLQDHQVHDFKTLFSNTLMCSTRLSQEHLQTLTTSGLSLQQGRDLKICQDLQLRILFRLCLYLHPPVVTSLGDSKEAASTPPPWKCIPQVHPIEVWFHTSEHEIYRNIFSFLSLKFNDTKRMGVLSKDRKKQQQVLLEEEIKDALKEPQAAATATAATATAPVTKKQDPRATMLKVRQCSVGDTLYALSYFELFQLWLEMCNGQSLKTLTDMRKEREAKETLDRVYEIPGEPGKTYPVYNPSVTTEKMLQMKKMIHEHAEDTCMICCDEFVARVVIACGHSFCKICIINWLTSGMRGEARKCPGCNQKVHIIGQPLQLFQPPQRINQLVQRLLAQPMDAKTQQLQLDTKIVWVTKDILASVHQWNVQDTVMHVIVSHFDHVLTRVREALNMAVSDASEEAYASRMECIDGRELMKQTNITHLCKHFVHPAKAGGSPRIQLLFWSAAQGRLPRYLQKWTTDIWCLEPPLHDLSYLAWCQNTMFVRTHPCPPPQWHVYMYMHTPESFLWKRYQQVYPTWDAIQAHPPVHTYGRHKLSSQTQSQADLASMMQAYFVASLPSSSLTIQM